MKKVQKLVFVLISMLSFLICFVYANNKESYYQMPAYKLSGGEQQRVALIRLLLKKAEIILADEPTGSLDLQNGYQVMNILKSFAEHGSIVVMVTHSNQFDSYFDQIINI
ncbi:ATP-binding cassette domain-containing protein [Oenococcus sicerae]|uniref:ATP-binding cassette domain-containing protein n=1 Tax=Oenococcus sicerae TaxID=2203724 RepID=A0AAJ1RDQ7_9LACO|nr:ATP-binding cassette domain-containing protein [Oenococcus sicerae]MDN6900041.1 ATP-binding cassette domain-containing protein [Oenococcus sicerae]QAS69650.1 ATP-binding cassette domain-containing protein [Oenococcus sicerae]